MGETRLDGSGDLSCDEFGILLSQLAASDWEEAFDRATGRSYFINEDERDAGRPDDDAAVGTFMETNGLANLLRKPPALGSLKRASPIRPAASASETVANPVAASSPRQVVPQRAVPPRASPARPPPSSSRALPARTLPPR